MIEAIASALPEDAAAGLRMLLNPEQAETVLSGAGNQPAPNSLSAYTASSKSSAWFWTMNRAP